MSEKKQGSGERQLVAFQLENELVNSGNPIDRLVLNIAKALAPKPCKEEKQHEGNPSM